MAQLTNVWQRATQYECGLAGATCQKNFMARSGMKRGSGPESDEPENETTTGPPVARWPWLFCFFS